MSNNCVLVFIEQHENKIAEVSLELLCKARELAAVLQAQVAAVTLGSKMQNELQILGHYGADLVYYIDDPRVQHFTSVPYAKAIIHVIKKYQPQIVLYGATINGRDLAPRIASNLRCGLTADCTDLQISENLLLQIRPAFGGNIVATIVSPKVFPSMATVREGVMTLEKMSSPKTVKVVEENCGFTSDDFPTKVLEVVRETKKVNLKAAKIIVAAGAGVTSQASLNLLRELAAVLGGELGATRPVVDAGLLSHDYQIGQTGTTVRPNLFIACGISGQLQHTAGMWESRRIIAINTDPNASIFKIAHYGIVGDLNDVLPKMIKAYKTKD